MGVSPVVCEKWLAERLLLDVPHAVVFVAASVAFFPHSHSGLCSNPPWDPPIVFQHCYAMRRTATYCKMKHQGARKKSDVGASFVGRFTGQARHMPKVACCSVGAYFPQSGRKGGFLPNAAPDAPHGEWICNYMRSPPDPMPDLLQPNMQHCAVQENKLGPSGGLSCTLRHRGKAVDRACS